MKKKCGSAYEQPAETTWSQDKGSKADKTKRVVSHARGNAARDVLEDEFKNSCEDDTTLEAESSDSNGENTYVEELFEVLLCLRKTSNTKSKYEGNIAGRKQGRGGLTLTLSVGEGRLQLKCAQ